MAFPPPTYGVVYAQADANTNYNALGTYTDGQFATTNGNVTTNTANIATNTANIATVTTTANAAAPKTVGISICQAIISALVTLQAQRRLLIQGDSDTSITTAIANLQTAITNLS